MKKYKMDVKFMYYTKGGQKERRNLIGKKGGIKDTAER